MVSGERTKKVSYNIVTKLENLYQKVNYFTKNAGNKRDNTISMVCFCPNKKYRKDLYCC